MSQAPKQATKQATTPRSQPSTPSALTGQRRILWQNVSTVVSAAILIGAEVFGAAFAGAWALANLFGVGVYGEYILQALFSVGGVAIMVGFIRHSMTIEPFSVTGR